MTNSPDDTFCRPSWRTAAFWMGCDLAALVRILAANRFRVRPAYWGDCLIDLAFAAGNSCVRAAESLLLARKVARRADMLR